MSIIRKEQLSNPLSASYALTASYAETTSFTINTSSLVTTSSFNAFTSSINQFTSSYNTGSFSGSFTGNLTGSAATASYYQETDPIFVAKSASLATTGSNTFTGNQIINGENLGLIVDASGLKRVGFMKYGGLEGSIARVANQNFRILRTTGSDINDGTSAITDFYIAGDGKIGIGTTSPAYSLDVSGSSNFTGDTLITGSLYQSGTFFPNQIDWFSSSIGYDTGSYILTTTANGLTTYANYQDVANTLNPYIPYVTTSSFNNFTSSYNTGSFTGSFSGSFYGTASWAESASQAISASHSISSSYSLSGSYAESASYALSSSYAISSSHAISSSYALTASYVNPLHQNVIITGSIYLATSSIYFSGSGAASRLTWNDTDGTLNLGLKGGNVTLQIGQEQVVRVVNKTGANLLESEYKVVRIRSKSEGGAQGQRLAVVLAQANNDANSVDTLGLVTENIVDSQEGFVTTFGLVNDIDTRGTLQGETWSEGDVLYLSPTTPGALTNIKPQAPNHTIIVGFVVYKNPVQGKIFVKVDNGYELDELHNVKITTASLSTGDLLVYSGSVWANRKQLTGNYAITGSLVLTNNLTVLGSQSVQYITSSQLNISTNLITVNTSTPAVRFGGLAVQDSGSLATGLTGSLLWDSQNDVWVYSNPSGALYDGGMLLVGPRNTSGLGNEEGINSWYAAIGNGSHHMTSSQIYNSGSLIRLETNTQITGSLDVSTGITGSLHGTSSWAESASNAIIATNATNAANATNITSPLTQDLTLNGNFTNKITHLNFLSLASNYNNYGPGYGYSGEVLTYSSAYNGFNINLSCNLSSLLGLGGVNSPIWDYVEAWKTNSTGMLGFFVKEPGTNEYGILTEGYIILDGANIDQPAIGAPLWFYQADDGFGSPLPPPIPYRTSFYNGLSQFTTYQRLLGHLCWSDGVGLWMLRFKPSNDWVII